MFCNKVTENIYQVTKNVEGVLFEGLWDIPNGVSLNSFVVKGDKVAIVDGMWNKEGAEDIRECLKKFGVKEEDVEYLIVNHMEPDHSGWLLAAREINPNAKIICNEKSKPLIEGFYGIKENLVVVKEGDIIDLGQGHKLKALMIPNVHWPDTMAMYDEKTGTLFCCDAFGSFGTIEDGKEYDDQLTKEEIDFYEKEAVRYYSNIVASFSMAVKSAIKKINELDVKIIAPGHGIVWRENPEKIINDYARYADYQKGIAKEEITLIWGSMYGMTEKAVNRILDVLKKEDIKVNVHRVPQDSWGAVLSSAWNSTGIILAMPTYEYKMFPPMGAVLTELGKKKVQGVKAFRVGSYGWSGGAQRELDAIMEENKMKWDFLEPVEFQGSPEPEELELIERRVKELVREVREAVKNK